MAGSRRGALPAPFTDFKSLAAKGSRIITKADNIYLWDSDGHRLLDAMSVFGALTSAMAARN